MSILVCTGVQGKKQRVGVRNYCAKEFDFGAVARYGRLSVLSFNFPLGVITACSRCKLQVLESAGRTGGEEIAILDPR